MEPVTEEFVEHAADFIYHLSDKQLEERIADFRKYQFNIHYVFLMEINKYREPAKKDFIWRIGLTLVMCFESYKIKLPMISMLTIKEMVVNDQKKTKLNAPKNR